MGAEADLLPEALLVDMTAQPSSDEKPKNSQSATELSNTTTVAENNEVSIRAIRADGNVVRTNTEQTVSGWEAQPSKDDERPTVPHSTSQKQTTKLRTERGGGLPRERKRSKTRNILSQKVYLPANSRPSK
jgi:hypothetical protein